MSLDEERFLEFTGDNWKDVLSFVSGGEFVTEYSLQDEGSEMIDTSYIYCELLDMNIVKGDYVLWINRTHLELFTAEEWRDYSLPEDVLEFERIVNLIIPYLKQGVTVFSLVEKISGGDISIEYIGKYDNGIELENKYSINGTDVEFTKIGSGNSRQLKVSVL